MFKTIRDIDFTVKPQNQKTDRNIKSGKVILDDSLIFLRPNVDISATEGLFGPSIEDKLKKFKSQWSEEKDHLEQVIEVRLTEKMAIAKKMESEIALFKEKLKNTTLNLNDITIKGLSYTDLIMGLEGVASLPSFVEQILAIKPEQTFKDEAPLYKLINNPPIAVKKSFVMDYDKGLTFRPEYHYRGGSKMHENESLEKLGYNSTNIPQLIEHVATSIAAFHKIASFFEELKRHYTEYENYGISQISRGVKENECWYKLTNLTHVIMPLWFQAALYSLASYPKEALSVVKEVVIHN